MEDLIQLDSYPVKTTLRLLLQDKTTKKNIIWATDSYASFGETYTDRSQITENQLKKMNYGMIQPRISKDMEQQTQRTRKSAEVFTPAWICNKMNNFCDEEWFGYKDVFNRQAEHEWIPTEDKIRFPDGRCWEDYIDSRRLEITCGEAPYLVSRYDAATGKMIDIHKRIGILDRKLRVVNENANDEAEWMKWTIRAFQSVYGYDYNTSCADGFRKAVERSLAQIRNLFPFNRKGEQMAKARKDNKGRALRKGESQRSQDNRYIYTYTDPMGKRGYIYATTLQELREKEDKLIRDQLDGLDLYVAGKANLDFVVDRYMATKNNLATSTYANYRYTYDHFCKDGFGKRKVAEIKYSDVLHFYLGLIEKGIKVKTVESLHCVLHPAFDLAVRDEIIRKNPSDGVISEIKKRQGRKQKVQRALTMEQQTELLNYVTDHPLYDIWRPLFTVLLGTGCRIGEICGLRWQDVDMEKRIIDINHSMTYFRRGKQAPYTFEFKFEPPKTKAGIRKIPMLDDVYEVLKEMYEYQKENGFSPLVVDGATGFIFINKLGNLYKHNAIDHSIRRIVNTHNAEEEIKAKKEHREPIMLPFFSCHTFRHTFCTRFCENETNVKVIQAVMGHADINTTMDIYAEVTETKKREAMENLSKNMKIF